MLSSEVLIVFLADIFDEFHGLEGVSVCLNPETKLFVFHFNFL